MIILYDTNVLIDCLIEREAFYQDAAVAWQMAELDLVQGWVSALSIATVYYVSRREFNRDVATKAVQKILDVFSIAAVDEDVTRQAMESGMKDFEDALQAFAGAKVKTKYVLTRDLTGFDSGPLAAVSPKNFLAFVSGAA